MLEDACGWARDVDWGTAPSWVTVLIAAIVGAFTIKNVRTATKAYAEGKWDTKVSQARRVYSHVTQAQTLPAGREWRGFGLSEKPDHLLGRYYLTEEQDRLSGEIGSTATQDLYVAHAQLVNNSDEPVGGVVVQLRQPDGSVIASDFAMTPGVLNAGETRTATLFVPFAPPSPMRPEDRPQIQLIYSDSAGHRWKRIGTAPPTEVAADES